jgi:hypothetical protein
MDTDDDKDGIDRISSEWELGVGYKKSGNFHDAAMHFQRVIGLLNKVDLSEDDYALDYMKALLKKAEVQLEKVLKVVGKNHYSALGLDMRGGTLPDQAAVKQSYKRMALKYHPDRNEHGGSVFIVVQKAYECLSNEEAKQIYDEGLLQKSEYAALMKRASHLDTIRNARKSNPNTGHRNPDNRAKQRPRHGKYPPRFILVCCPIVGAKGVCSACTSFYVSAFCL